MTPAGITCQLQIGAVGSLANLPGTGERNAAKENRRSYRSRFEIGDFAGVPGAGAPFKSGDMSPHQNQVRPENRQQLRNAPTELIPKYVNKGGMF
jgi:hypothetical protein